ncbi:hypothetical protein NXG27_07395 [Megasphaera paucivorans]|uniref:Uncharacterized protein n=1 Tax=Megasphaera paucivorans TaxID=349095 RepID=A0A1G9WX61_9FIRM|nr:hypothetical protein [Megasphaera paucivorans]SDM89070.1 hypothetical protein SAMN05660299_01702 [Megasphaera paucivorans]
MLNRKLSRMMKTGIILLAILVLGVIGYTAKNVMGNQLLPSSPQYVVSHAIDAYKQHDTNTFNNYVDINAVSASVNTSWHDYKKNSFNRAFTSCPANSEPTFNRYINDIIGGKLKLEQQNTEGNIGVAYILLNISDYKIINIKNIADDSKSFDLVAKAVGNSAIVIPMTIKKSGDDWKINSVNVTNLFVSYDNEVKRQAVEFDKASKPYDEKIKNITGAGDVSLNTEMGLFIEERTVKDRIKKGEETEKLLNTKIDKMNQLIDLVNGVPDTNEVGKIYKFYSLNILNYAIKKFTIQLQAVQKVNENYRNAIKDGSAFDTGIVSVNNKNIDIYGEVDKSVKQLGYVDGSFKAIKAIDELAK